MAKKPYVTIDAEILTSTVWREPAHVKLVWITMLILCDLDGYVGASIPGIASAAGVTDDQCVDALTRFQEPDKFSRTKSDEGRRVKEVERGFQILNFMEHLNRMSSERTKTRERVKKFRQRQKEKKQQETPVTLQSTIGSREVGSREVRTTYPPPSESVGGYVRGENLNRAEAQTTGEIRRLQMILGEHLILLAEHKNSRDMVTTWCRRATSYTKQDGTKIPGVSDFRTVTSIDRLEKSIEDAKRWLKRLDQGPLKVGA